MEEENKKYPVTSFVETPLPSKYLNNPKAPFKVLRSRNSLVQLYKEGDYTRISVNLTRIKDTGDWEEGITWDNLMDIKRQLGYGDFDAVEVYPKDNDVVNVANIRHLFILNEPLPFIWRKNP
jgi:hypothetical protein